MKTVVYLDVLLGVNFIIGWFLLRAAGRLTSASPPAWRMWAGSAAAALSTLILLAPPLPLWAQTAARLGSALVIVAVAFGYGGLRSFLRRTVWYFVLNLLLAGVVCLALYWFGPGGVETNNMVIYIDLSPQVLILSVLLVWLALRLMELIFAPPSTAPLWMELEYDGKKLRLPALGDTGCRLKDPLTGQGVVLVWLEAAKELLGAGRMQAARAYLAGEVPEDAAGLRLVPCGTAAGPALLPAFGGVEMRLRQGHRALRRRRVTMALSPHPFQPGDHPALAGADWLEQLQELC